MDFEQIGRELLVALRGKRSQVAWSRRLGYRSNVAYAWESGRRWPTAAETFRAAERTGIDTRAAIVQFLGRPPRWLDKLDPSTAEGVAALLDDLRGSTTITDLSRRADLSRYSMSRWLSGQTQPRLPDFLRTVDAASLRTVDLVAALVDPEQVPSVIELWRTLEARRQGAYRVPWTSAVLRALELEDYRALTAHEDGWIASRLHITPDEEARCLTFLRDTGQVVFTGTHYAQREVLTIDTRRSREASLHLKAHWTSVARDRIETGAPGQFSWNVFTVSRADFERIREAHLAYFRELRSIVSESEPAEVVGVANVQLFALTDRPEPVDD